MRGTIGATALQCSFVLIFYVFFFTFVFFSLSTFPSRLWSSWIPNFSRCLTWSELTGANGRNWIRRDKVARVGLHPRAPPVATAQTPVAALWPKQAAHRAVAAVLMVQHLNVLVSFCCHIWADLFFFPLKCSLQQRQCSACRGSWALLLFAFATRDSRLCFRLECSAITKVFLLPSVFPCWRLT